jgi:hypothetical protein
MFTATKCGVRSDIKRPHRAEPEELWAERQPLVIVTAVAKHMGSAFASMPANSPAANWAAVTPAACSAAGKLGIATWHVGPLQPTLHWHVPLLQHPWSPQSKSMHGSLFHVIVGVGGNPSPPTGCHPLVGGRVVV